MSRAKARFTQADVARVLRAMKSVEFDGHLEIRPDGTMVVRAGNGAPLSVMASEPDLDFGPSERRKRIRL